MLGYRGDVIVATSPKDCSQLICKRIIGMVCVAVCCVPFELMYLPDSQGIEFV